MSHVSCFGKGGSLSLAPPGKPQVAPFSTEKVQVFFVQGVGRKKITHYEVWKNLKIEPKHSISDNLWDINLIAQNTV